MGKAVCEGGDDLIHFSAFLGRGFADFVGNEHLVVTSTSNLPIRGPIFLVVKFPGRLLVLKEINDRVGRRANGF